MTLVGAGRAVARPAIWLLRGILRGMTIIGLSMHGRPYQEADPEAAAPRPVPIPAPRITETTPRTGLRDDLASIASLTPDELLWQAELE